MSPLKPVPDSQKAKSPSKNIQRGVDTAWNSQSGTTDPNQALADKYTKHPVPVNGEGK